MLVACVPQIEPSAQTEQRYKPSVLKSGSTTSMDDTAGHDSDGSADSALAECESEEDCEEYNSDEEAPALTDDRARRKLAAAVNGMELDLAMLPNFDKPYHEVYDRAAARPTLGSCKFYAVEVYEAMQCYRNVLSGHTNSPRSAIELLAQMHHMTEAHCLLLRLSLLLDVYIECLRGGRLRDVEQHPDDADELEDAPRVTAETRFAMRAPRVAFSPETRAGRKEETLAASGRSLLKMLTDLAGDLRRGLATAGVETPVTWRVAAPHIVFVRAPE